VPRSNHFLGKRKKKSSRPKTREAIRGWTHKGKVPTQKEARVICHETPGFVEKEKEKRARRGKGEATGFTTWSPASEPKSHREGNEGSQSPLKGGRGDGQLGITGVKIS